jgi:IS5 family transposase
VIDQARRRVLQGESVPNEEKLFSLFEPHTELLKRGKAGKAIEFGHMIQIQQVAEKFITDYEVYARKPAEPGLLEPALASHRALFGADPCRLAADKGYYETGAVRRLAQSLERSRSPRRARAQRPKPSASTIRSSATHRRSALASKARSRFSSGCCAWRAA